MRKVMTAVALSFFALAGAACNTVDGAGEDIESVSDKVDEEI